MKAETRRFLSLTMFLLGVGCGGVDPAAITSGDEPVPHAPGAEKGVVVDGTRVGKGGPGGAYFQNKFFLSYTGADDRLNVMRQSDTGVWEKQILNQRSVSGSSLAEFAGRLFLVWIGTDGRLNSLESTDGVSWPDNTHRIFGEGTDNSRYAHVEPALVAYSGALNAFVARVPHGLFADTDHNWRVHGGLRQYLNFGGGWSDLAHIVPAETKRSPSAAVLGPDLVVAWSHRDGNSLRTKKFVLNTGWLNEEVIPYMVEGHLLTAHTSPPSLLFTHRVVGGNIGVDQIEFDRTTDGRTFQFVTRVQDKTFARPIGMWSNSTVAFYAHVGTDSNRTLNFTWTQF